MTRPRQFCALLVSLLSLSARLGAEGGCAPSLIAVHGHIYTGDPSKAWVEALAVCDGVYDKGALRGKQCNDQKKSACCNKKQSAHREGSLGMFIGSQ
jgi:hypothetical protein